MPELGRRVGITVIDYDEGLSKRERARRSVESLSRRRLAEVLRDLGADSGDYSLEERGLRVLEEAQPQISEITRRDIARCFGDDLSGARSPVNVVQALFPLSGPFDFSFLTAGNTRTLADEIHQHMVLNPGDWDVEELFDQIGAYGCSTDRFGRLLEGALHPLCRRGPEQRKLVATLNAVLKADGYALEPIAEQSGHPIYKLVLIVKGVAGAPKNLIFASIGPKPEIGFRDAVNNDIVVLSHADSCLIYDRPISRDGLRWSELVDWWSKLEIASIDRSAKGLAGRLHRSLASDGERNLFTTYFKLYRKTLDEALPALIPQVYLHYDPAVVKHLRHRDGMFRQRMDFLLLLPNAQRVVLEVDGAQHFSDDAGPSLPRYSQMVAADRELRLVGYEVFRFGANELVGPNSEGIVRTFFDGLWRRHSLSTAAEGGR
ncbi:MAG: hypothetical protein GC145_07940 [Caulobacter sp.]|nr:hypothetical protein [Caulobacter sp.]